MSVFYHGTNKSAWKSIQQSGFLRKDSWLTPDIDTALGYGGPVVLTVEYERPPGPHDYEWQFITNCEIPTSEINRITTIQSSISV